MPSPPPAAPARWYRHPSPHPRRRRRESAPSPAWPARAQYARSSSSSGATAARSTARPSRGRTRCAAAARSARPPAPAGRPAPDRAAGCPRTPSPPPDGGSPTAAGRHRPAAGWRRGRSVRAAGPRLACARAHSAGRPVASVSSTSTVTGGSSAAISARAGPAKRARSMSCCTASAPSAAATFAVSSRSAAPSSSAWLKWLGAAVNRVRNQAWIGLGGKLPAAGPRAAPDARASGASAATVRCARMSAEARVMPAAPSRAAIWMARMESPPRAKKSSWILSLSRPSTSANMATSAASRASRGGSGTASPRGGAGSARRSILPLALSGMRSSFTICAGTIQPGSARRDARARR